MKKWIFCLMAFVYASQAYAADCTQFKKRIHKLEDLRRHGGSLKQMERWRIQADELSTKLSQCNREQAIQITSGAKTKGINTPARSNLKLRKANSSDPQIQRLLATCNYWISEFNKNSSATNASFKDTACRALDDKLASNETSSLSAESAIVRSLSDCIKPNNLIDKDVHECRQGLRNPVWKK
ncbi:hypothetical protein [Cellvibrio sp.]|uniref:hypothetical protein n=1 Tax=Cellvibrio sp. TaxID=1965322 RepID=UPI00396480E0